MPKPVLEIYRDKRDEWRWKLKAPNGEIIVNSSKGYKTKVQCIKRIDALRFYTQIATISIAEEIQEKGIIGYEKQIFFSHSSNDEGLIDLIKLVFEFTDARPYFAVSDRAAQNPADKVLNAIGTSNALFALVTSSVLDKRETLLWVIFEIGVAKAKRLPIYVWIEKGGKVPEVISYITDYTRFKSKEAMDRQKVVREMIRIASRV